MVTPIYIITNSIYKKTPLLLENYTHKKIKFKIKENPNIT